MELPRRNKEDIFLPDGSLRRLMEDLRQYHDAHDLRIVIVNAFDFRTRMLPYWYADKRMAPCSVRTLADVLNAAGFKHIRVVLQQWTPRFKPSVAELDGKRPDILLTSAMQVHAEPSYDLIRDAHRMGAARPLILAGGPKAIYEPTDYFDLGPEPGIGADCVVTGEAYVLLSLLKTVLQQRRDSETPREAFERARQSGVLRKVPGLVYLAPDAPPSRLFAINTGIQQLIRDFDELPMPDAGYRLLEPPHRRQRLSKRPVPAKKVWYYTPIASLLVTQGCRFNCSYCPIPGANQKTRRHKSPQRFAAEIKHLHETFGINGFFGTDDNFFNDRDTVVTLMREVANTTSGGVSLGKKITFYTEATQFDVYKNRDILPLCYEGGLRGLWFGIEDLTGELVKKGQKPGTVSELFRLMREIGIEPHAMMIHSDTQPLETPHGNLSGLLNQARYIFDKGAVTYQCTYLGPAVGSRDIEPAAKARAIFRYVGGKPLPQAFQDGNHVAASKHPKPWRQQLNLLRAYATFYNPVNLLHVLLPPPRNIVGLKRLLFQILGQIGLLITVPKMLHWALRLKRGPIEPFDGLIKARIPMVDAHSGQQINWAIENLPAADLPPGPVPKEMPYPAAPQIVTAESPPKEKRCTIQ